MNPLTPSNSVRKVLVTGAGGRVGRFVVDALRDDYTLAAMEREDVSVDIERAGGDILNLEETLRAVAGQDAVIHLAGLVRSLGAGPADIFHTNVQGTWNVLHAAHVAGVRKVILCSSECATGVVFADPRRPPAYLPIDEAHPLAPLEDYGLSKKCAETVACSFAGRGGMQIVVLRPTLVLTPDLQDQVTARGQNPTDPDLWGYVEPQDVAAAFGLALAYDGAAYEVFFISAADTLSPQPTLELVKRFYGKLPQVRNPELYRQNPNAAIFDISRAQKHLGYRPRSDWRRFA